MKSKFLLLIVFVSGIVSSSKAQITKGSTWVGGNIGFNSSKRKAANVNDNGKLEEFFINPAFGKAIKENLVLGADLNFSHSEMENFVF